MWELIGELSYDPSSPDRIYFSIGSAIAVIALLLTFDQMARPIIKLWLRTGMFSEKFAYTLFFIAIGFVFVAAILPFVHGPLYHY
jgi:hypothetical protein